MIWTLISDFGYFLLLVIFLIMSVIYHYLYKKRSRTSLKNKHVVITGGSSGIGKSLAMEAAHRGANVTLIGRDETKLNKAKHEVLQHCIHSTQRVLTVSLDVCADYEELVKGVEHLEQECGPVYMLFNCAGKAICGKLEDISPSEIKNLCDLNYIGSIMITKVFIEGMKSQGEGHIVFTSSAAGLLGVYGYTAYSASKFALRGLAEALYMETQCHGIKVTIAYPPDTDTPGFAIEEQRKPKETRLISESAGLYQPSVVASQVMQDALAGKFTSYIGFEGFLLVTLTAGMSPFYSLVQLLNEVTLLGPCRLIAAFYIVSFKRIIHKCMAERNKSKKSE